MPVNLSEKAFFEQLSQQPQDNMSSIEEKQSIAYWRAGAEVFLQYAGDMADVDYRDVSVPVRDGNHIKARIFNSDITTVDKPIFFFPGCGYILDLFETNAIACSRIAKYLGRKIILINYRLAPEYPLPIPVYDGYDAINFFIKNANQFNIDNKDIFTVGLSSGANCAAAIAYFAQALKEFNIKHQVLLNGYYDLHQTNHDFDFFEEQDEICKRSVINDSVKFWGVAKEDFNNPIFSPYYQESFEKFPATTIIVGEYDGIRNDSESYYNRLKHAGVGIEKIVLPGQTHNTIIMRKVMSEGEDPAKVIADVIAKNYNT